MGPRIQSRPRTLGQDYGFSRSSIMRRDLPQRVPAKSTRALLVTRWLARVKPGNVAEMVHDQERALL